MHIFQGIEHAASGIYHKLTGTMSSKQKRAIAQQMADQVNLYKQQTELAESEIARKRDEELQQKRMIQEKQIRSLRHSYRPAGFMDVNAGSGEMTDKLGG